MYQLYCVLGSTAGFSTQPVSVEQQKAACAELEKLGLTVVNCGSLSAVVQAPAKLLERVFGAKIRRLEQGRTTRKLSEAARSARWRFETPPQIPASLGGLVTAVALVQPSELHQT